MRVDFFGLQAFVSIAARGSFQAAATSLNLSQTALSHRMRKFENDLGVKLMIRSTPQVTLTAAGMDLLPKARQIMDDLQTSLDAVRKQGSVKQQQLALGCLPTLASHYLPPILHEFALQHPNITVRIYDNSATEIVERVAAGDAEFGITILAANRPDMEARPLMKEPFVLVAPASHAIAAQQSVDWSDLAGLPLIRISSQAGNRLLIDNALGSRRESLVWQYEVQHVSTAINMVAAQNGFTVVPSLLIDAMGTPGIVARPLRNPGISRVVGLVFKRGGVLSPAAQDLIALIEKGRRQSRPASRQRIAATA
ncbi:LysR family transcriptional regulator [Acidisphaera sp. L21]|uniref:LysR family transcriptional regulator n=1 Tax=Acidisphaera sp. L21 TaxID=1641851 RepID=UPI00131D537E|nr:LysR family transcriptional regulator [Acidisphaera sp. L21]